MNITCGKYSDCSDANIVCIAAGAKQEIGETRMDLIYKNSSIFQNIIENVMKSGFDGIFLVATNPLDIMTYLTWKYSKLPAKKIIGTGTSLDTARLRFLLGDTLHINPKNVHAYVIGEHGDSEFIPWSNVNIGLQNITDFVGEDVCSQIEENVKNAAYDIIQKKGATYYGIGMCLVRITNAILNDENSIITVSTYDKENNVFIGLPTVLNKEGATRRIYVKLNEEETKKLENSIFLIKEAIKKIDK
jgi:L-lactate dehydrogenase